MKRAHPGEDTSDRPGKLLRAPAEDRLSKLSDELLVQILSFGSASDLIVCQRVSKKFSRLAVDSELWKAAYYNQFVRPRAARIPGIKDTKAASEHLCYSSKLSKWLDDEHLVKEGSGTIWKKQYRLRHNWSQGQCTVSEIVIAERPPEPPLLVIMQKSTIFTADSISGLRAWDAKNELGLMAFTSLVAAGSEDPQLPTSMTIDMAEQEHGHERLAIGFEDGSFTIFALSAEDKRFKIVYNHMPSSNEMLSALAYCSPYLLTMAEDHLFSLYNFSEDKQADEQLETPQLLYSLRSHTAWPPVSLSLRPSSTSMTAAIAYALPTHISGWTVGIQEMWFSHTGELIESRLAIAAEVHSQTQPTSMSYSHPYLLVTHPDNTLTLYLVRSTSSSLEISSGTRLWGHTSSVSGAYVGIRGKAVSVSRLGDELRVWDLEGGMASLAAKRRSTNGELSVRVQPAKAKEDVDGLPDIESQRHLGLRFWLEQGFDDSTVSRGWVGFDEQNAIVLREKSEGSQALVVYDFA